MRNFIVRNSGYVALAVYAVVWLAVWRMLWH